MHDYRFGESMEDSSELLRVEQETAFVEIVHPVMVSGARNVSRLHVDGFVLAGEPLGSSGIDKAALLGDICNFIRACKHMRPDLGLENGG